MWADILFVVFLALSLRYTVRSFMDDTDGMTESYPGVWDSAWRRRILVLPRAYTWVVGWGYERRTVVVHHTSRRVVYEVRRQIPDEPPRLRNVHDFPGEC